MHVDALTCCRYRADTNGILLVEVFFTVRAARPGPVAGALELVRTSMSLWPSWRSPYYQLNSFNGASSASGAISVAQAATLGMWAWADRYELINTAAINGQQVSTAVRGVLVRSYAGSGAGTSDTPSCSIAAVSGPRPATVAVDAVQRVCVVSVNAVHAVPAKQLAVTLSLPDGAADQTAQVGVVGTQPGVASKRMCKSHRPAHAYPATNGL